MTLRKLLLILAGLLILLFAWEAGTRFLSGQKIIDVNKTLPQNPNASIRPEENIVTNIVDVVGPAVITIAVTSPQQVQDPFSFLFGETLPDENADNQTQDIGSGFIVQKDGLIVTNKHVVSSPDFDYTVIDSQNKSYKVVNIYRDPLNDVAILQVENPPAEGFPVVKLGNSDNLKVGQYAIAIGTALGEFRNTVTTGVVSGLGRGITAGSPFEGFVERLDNVIQTDAAISSGNSGGPLLNTSGEVIGVNTAVSRSGQNIGFAIPINVIKESLNNFENTGRFERPFLGVSYRELTKEEAEQENLTPGALVDQVTENSAAAQAGIKPGDIIIKIDNKNVTDEKTTLASIISTKKIGDTIKITLIRNGEQIESQATLGTTPTN